MKVFHAVLISIVLITASTPSSALSISGVYRGINDADISFESLKGRLLLVDATASWCPSCDTQLINLEEVYESAGNALTILTLSVDYKDDNIEKVKEIQSRFNSPWKFGWDYKQDFQKDFTISALPSLYLFSASGKFIKAWVGVTESGVILQALNAENSDIPTLHDTTQSIDSTIEQGSLIGNFLSNPIILPVFSMITILGLYLKFSSKPNSK